MVEKISSSKDLKVIEDKREALEKAVKIALNVERLQRGLEATLLMGKPTSDLPDEALATIEALEESIKSQPISKLKESLATLELLVKSSLAQILEISELNTEQLVAPGAVEIEALLNDYSKQAQTAVALRILLHSRGEATAPTELNVPAEQIRARLTAVEQKERTYRKIIKTELVTMIAETERMLSSTTPSPAMRQFLLASNDDLQRNMAHLESGKKITTMPVAIEIIEMSEREITRFDTAPIPTQTVQTPTVQKQRLIAPMEHTPTPPMQELQHPEKKRGFLARFIHWLTTPDQVTWKHTKQGHESKNSKKK